MLSPNPMKLLPFAAVLLATTALADEGMWTFNNFPSDKVKQKYGFAPPRSGSTKCGSRRRAWRRAARRASSRRTAS